MGQHQPHMYNVPGAAGTNAFPYGQLGQPGTLGYRPIQGFIMPGGPGPHLMQYGRPNVSGAMSETIAAVQAPYFTGNIYLCLNNFVTKLLTEVPIHK